MFIEQLTVKVLPILSFRTSPTEEKIVLKDSGTSHFSTLGAIPHVCKVSIDLLTLAGLSANISMDRPANLGMCTVSLQTCRPWQVYGQFSDRVDLVSQTC